MPDYQPAKIKTVTPPVVETVMGIQFPPLENMKIQHYAMLWERFKAEFDSIEEHERLPPIIESRETSGAIMAWRIVAGVQLPRIWLVGNPSAPGQYILQFQDDRFLMNWRTNMAGGADYPSHATNLAKFQSYLEVFLDLVHGLGLGRVEPEQCELTYVNHVQIVDKQPAIVVAADAFTFLRVPKQLTGMEENFSFNSSSWSEDLRGRVYTSLQSAAHRETREPLLDFRLTARGAPRERTDKGAVDWLDRGHTIVIGSFANFTSKKMHDVWGIQ